MPTTSESSWVQGVVVKPALAIPYFTGVAAFVGNIISLANSIQKWQDTIVNKVLEELEPVMNRIKPGLIDALAFIIDQIDAAIEQVKKAREQVIAASSTMPLGDSIQNSPLACMSNIDMLVKVRDKLEVLKNSIENNDISGVASNLSDMKDDATSAFRAAQNAEQSLNLSSVGATVEKGMAEIKNKVSAEISSIQNKAQLTFRKLNESEMVLLLRSLWTSIRWPALAAFMFQISCLIHSSQRGTRSFCAQHHHSSRDIFAPARPISSLHFHRHRHFLGWQRSFCRCRQCWTHSVCRCR
jgi:hypothetical protein